MASIPNRIGMFSIVIVLLTAGCLGGGAAAGPADSDTSDDSMSPAESNQGLSVADDTVSMLQQAGSYSASWELRATQGTDQASVTKNSVMIDYTNERSFIRFEGESSGQSTGGMEAFHADGVTFRKVGDAEKPSFMAIDESFNPTLHSTIRPMITSASDLEGFDFTGTRTMDGVAVKRYVLTERAPWLMAQSQLSEGFQLTDMEYEVMIDGDGLVRYERWHVEGTEEGVDKTVTMEYSLTGVGFTTVEDPEWMEMAKAQTGRA